MAKASFWQKFLKNPYKWGLWHWVGGRPWSDIARDFYHKYEYFIIVGGITLGYYLHYWVAPGLFWIGIGVLTSGYILGHLYWGKKYIPGQEG